MKPALIYIYWQNKPDPILKNSFSPILQSIATFRHFNKEVPVYVLDVDQRGSWNDWPERLGFKVLHNEWVLKHVHHTLKWPLECKNTFSPQLLSRPESLLWLIDQIPEDLIVSCDTDIVFVKDMFPLIGNTSQLNMMPNIGVFYFNKNDPKFRKFLYIWSSMAIAGCHSLLIRNEITQRPEKTRFFHEEAVAKYLIDECSENFNIANVTHDKIYENFLLHYFVVHENNYNPDKIKAIHLNYHLVDKKVRRCSRSQWFMMFEESNRIMREVFTEKEIFDSFGSFEGTGNSYKDVDFMRQWIKT